MCLPEHRILIALIDGFRMAHAVLIGKNTILSDFKMK